MSWWQQHLVHIHKYARIFSLHWQNSLTYPVSFVLWRTRQFLITLTSLTLWTVIFNQQQSAFGYSQASMTSYILLSTILQSIVLSTFLNGLAQDIYTGQISNMLLKPLRPLSVFVTQEFADKSLNIAFATVETIIAIYLFKPEFILPDPLRFGLFALATFLGACLLFSIMLIFGSVGFWSAETWGPRFLFYMFLDFTAGRLYPLNVLPEIVQKILLLTPFPYLTYVQTQIFLGIFSIEQSLQVIGVLLVWITILSLIFRRLWNTGMREYGALGR